MPLAITGGSAMHVPGDPGRHQLRPSRPLFDLERGDRAVCDLSVLDRRLELRMLDPRTA